MKRRLLALALALAIALLFDCAVAEGQSGGFTYALLADGSASITGCSLTGDIVIPGSIDGHTVTNLARQLFYGSGSVTGVTIPASVTYFGDNPNDSTFTYVFSYCYSLKSIRVEPGNPSFRSEDGVLYSRDRRILYNYPCARPGEAYTVPSSTRVLDCTSFASAEGLISLTLESPDTVWRTYTFFNDGRLTVHYLTGGASEATAMRHIESGLSAESDSSYPTYQGREPASTPTPSPTPTATPSPEPTATVTPKPTATVAPTPTPKPTVVPKKVSIAQGKKASLKVGKTLKLKVELKPADAVTKLTWKSSDKKVATVSKKGVVKAKKPGKAKITVTTANGKKASITITVKR